MYVKELIPLLKPGYIILSNKSDNKLYYFNFNYVTIYFGDNLKNRIKNIFEKKIYFNNINNTDKYVMDESFNFVPIEHYLSDKTIVKIYNLIDHNLLLFYEYEDLINKEILITNLIKSSINNRCKNLFNLILEEIEQILNIKFRKRLSLYNEFMFYNIYFKRILLTYLHMEF